jgi:hypothetical protein
MALSVSPAQLDLVARHSPERLVGEQHRFHNVARVRHPRTVSANDRAFGCPWSSACGVSLPDGHRQVWRKSVPGHDPINW